MLIPESMSEKEKAHLERMTAWLAKLPAKDRKRYCDHGNSAVIAFMTCKYCIKNKEEI